MHGDGGFDENMIDWDKVEITTNQDKLLDGLAAAVEGGGNYRAAAQFLEACGLSPNPDAIEQLADGFLPALRIICERAHSPRGVTWRKAGWRGQLFELMKKTDRLRYRSWERDIADLDSADDIINYAAFYRRGVTEGLSPWEDWGSPGSSRGLGDRPTVVCICGSGRFSEKIFDVAEHETMAGKIVLRPDVNTKNLSVDQRSKEALDELHLRKIDMSDEVIIVSEGGYIGDSTRAEIRYAMSRGKDIIFLEPEAAGNAWETQREHFR